MAEPSLKSSVHIRPYIDDDWSAVETIYNLAKPDELQGIVPPDKIPLMAEDEHKLRLFRESQVLVQVVGEDIVGFCGHRGNYISWLFIHPQYRRRGYGLEMTRTLLGRLTGKVTLNVAKQNSAAVQLYHRLGFRISNSTPSNFVGYPVDVLTMTLEIE